MSKEIKDNSEEFDFEKLRANTSIVGMGTLGAPPGLYVPPPKNARRLSGAQEMNLSKSLMSTRRNTVHVQAENPQILNNTRYAKLYNDILRDVDKTHKYLKSEKNSLEKDIVKRSIAKVIRLNS
jgi:hypothetical protein